MDTIRLETSNLLLHFDRKTGSLVGLYSKCSDWNILCRPELGMSFQMMIPLKDRRNNNAYGTNQEQPECHYNDKSVSFTWRHLNTEFCDNLPITITTVCEILHDQPVFRMHIENYSPYMVENVYYPCFGDFHRPNSCSSFKFMHGGYSTFAEYPLYPSFPVTREYWGNEFPVIIPSNTSNFPPLYPFALAQDDKGNGFYIGIAEHRMEAATWKLELHPGYSDSMTDLVPDADNIDGQKVYTVFSVAHLPFIAPGKQFDLLPFSIDSFRGDWHAGAACYLKRRSQWKRSSAADDCPAWAKEPHSWLQIQMNSPEDELRLRYTDLPKIGEECCRLGIKAIQLVGWNAGGQDRGNPVHDTEPRLGTFEELKSSIAQIQAMGVKVILFVKFVWADRSRDDFKDIYKPLAVKDPYGGYYMHDGYMYYSMSQFTHTNTRRLVPMCFSSETYRSICRREFQKCVDLGADGILYDESHHHSPALCCFDTSHGHRYGESVYRNDDTLIHEFREMLNGRPFLFCGEALYDSQFDTYHLSYTRTWNRKQNTAKFGSKHMALSRFLRPYSLIMTAVNGFDDRNMINQCLLNRYIVSYEPFNFKGTLSDFPATVSYGQKMERLRTELRGYFWDGKYCGTEGATIVCQENPDFVDYATYQSIDNKIGCVICNYNIDKPIHIHAEKNGESFRFYRFIDDEFTRPFLDVLQIPPRSAAVII